MKPTYIDCVISKDGSKFLRLHLDEFGLARLEVEVRVASRIALSEKIHGNRPECMVVSIPVTEDPTRGFKGRNTRPSSVRNVPSSLRVVYPHVPMGGSRLQLRRLRKRLHLLLLLLAGGHSKA